MGKLDNLRFELQKVSFKDEWGIDFNCSYESTYPAWQIAADLNSPFGLLPPGCVKKSIYRVTPLHNRYSLREIGIEEIATVASDIWCSSFESKMREALFELMIETRALTLIKLTTLFPGKAPFIDAKKLFNALFKACKDNRRRRLDTPLHGGGRRGKDYRTPSLLVLYALYVTILKRLWKDVIEFFKERDYSSECINEFKKTRIFEILSGAFPLPSGVLEDILTKVHKYRCEGKIKPEHQPLGFALQHANAILNIHKTAKYNTLRSHYQEGLAQARKYKGYQEYTILDEMFFSKIKRSRRKAKK